MPDWKKPEPGASRAPTGFSNASAGVACAPSAMPFAEQRADTKKSGGGRHMRMLNRLALGAGLVATTLAAPAHADDAKVAAIVKGLDNPFFQTMQKGIEEQAKADASQSPCRPPQIWATRPDRPTS